MGIPSVKRNSSRSAGEVPSADSPCSVITTFPGPVSADVCDSKSPPTEPDLVVPAVPPSPIERLHAIRAQAERRLSARMQQLQAYPFSAGNTTPTVDPVIEERLMRERKEAEEKARMMDKEIEELEKARRRKHNDALKRPPSPRLDRYLESVKSTFADIPEVYQNILKLLIDRFNATDSYVVCYLRDFFDNNVTC